MRLLLLFIPILLSNYIQAADTVRVSSLTYLTGQTNLSLTLDASVPSDGGVTEASPSIVYVPMATTTTATTTDYYFLNSLAGPNYALFGYTAIGGSKATFTNYYITFPLVTSIDSVAKYLYAAVKSASSYIVVAKSALINPVTNQENDLNVSPQSICEGAAAGAINCTNFDDNVPGTVSESTRALSVYFFVSTASLTVGSGDIGAPDVTTYPGGIFFQVKMSNQIYKNTEISMTLSELRKGDRRVSGTFLSSSTISTDYKGTYAYLHKNATDSCVSIREPGRCQGAFGTGPVSSEQNGDFTLNNLTNGAPVTVSIALLDKYGFSTTLSNSITQTPVEIQELLKKQACFLLTAGFGEEHYVINFFRAYRDHILANSWLGKKFIKVYYRTAPQYAMIIYKNEILRLGIRSVAYILYFFFNYYLCILLVLSLIFLLFYYFNSKNKVFIKNNQL